ncbi:MAG: archaetidylserine decarboxylase [Bdellovibrionia bacterium]
MSFVTHFLPRRRLSRWIGYFMHWEGPRWWAEFSIQAFARLYNINLEEAEHPVSHYKSIGDFFVRRLKSGARPLAESPVLHPADSVITQRGVIQNDTLIQAKGLVYNLKEFTEDPEAQKKWDGGYFLTYYLCPTAYHRVHSPVDGNITNVRYLPGDLWPVNEWSTTNIPELFVKNERVVVEIESEFGPVALVLVGATNVGFIELAFDESIKGNQTGPHILKHKRYEPEIPTHRGSEVGRFRMGSTVVMIYPKAFTEKYLAHLDKSTQVKVNTALVHGH